MAPSADELAEFFRVRKVKFDRCWEPSLQCDQPAINAHSIQNRRVIDLLQKDNHVVAWQPRFSNAMASVELRPVGRNEASTFTGFCNEHDTKLFRPLDTKPLDVSNAEQLFLIAYRGITCELHAVANGVHQFQTLYNSRVERGVDKRDSSSPAGQKALEQMLLGHAVWRYRNTYYDAPFLERSLGDIEHHVIEFDNQSPCLAASSFFTVTDAPISDELKGVAINVLPVNETKTVAVFSYPRADRGVIHTALDRVFNSAGDYQKYELSLLIINRISNVLFSPRHIETWKSEKKAKVTDALLASVRTLVDAPEGVDLMLF